MNAIQQKPWLLPLCGTAVFFVLFAVSAPPAAVWSKSSLPAMAP